MPQNQIQGKSIKAIAKDIVEGFAFLNPIFLKKFDHDAFKTLHHTLKKTQTEIRTEKFPLHDVSKLRKRNMRLQRLHQAMMILEYAAKEKKFSL
jgi:hypothetical protein